MNHLDIDVELETSDIDTHTDIISGFEHAS